MKYLLSLLCCLFWGAAVVAGDLAERLPVRTIGYLQVDLAKAGDEVQQFLRLIDPENGEKLIFQAKELRQAVCDLATAHELDQAWVNTLLASKAYVVVTARDKPEVRKKVQRVPKWDPEKGQEIPGEFIEDTFTSVENYTYALVVQTEPAQAQNWLDGLKKALAREKEKSKEPAEAADYEIAEVEVEKGSLIAIGAEKNWAAGVLDNLFIVANAPPLELWASLMTPPESSLAGSELYRRFQQESGQAFGLVNIDFLTERFEAELQRELDEARKAATAAQNKPKPAPPADKKSQDKLEPAEGEVDEAALDLTDKQHNLAWFQSCKNLLGLNKIKFIGLSSSLRAGEQEARVDSSLVVQVGEGAPPALMQLLNGGTRLRPPEVGRKECLAFLGRAGVKEVYGEVMKSLPPESAQTYQLMMGMMKAQVGYDLGELLSLLAGDLYVFVDVVRKDYEQEEWNEKAGKMELKKLHGPMPEVVVLLGLKDPENFAKTLSGIFARLSTLPQAGQYVKKRAYQETDVYLVGANVGKENAQPDGLRSFAVVAVGPYLSFGTWDDVTALIRRFKSPAAAGSQATSPLAALAAKSGESNFLMVMPKGVGKKLEDIINEAENAAGKNSDEKNTPKSAPDFWQKAVDELPLPAQDDEIGKRLKAALKAMAELMSPLTVKKEAAMAGDYVLHGKLSGNFYEMKAQEEYRKTAP